MKHIRLWRWLAWPLRVAVLAVGCAPCKLLDTQVDFSGHITQVQRVGQAATPGMILVESKVATVDKCSVTLSDGTLILEQAGKGRRAATWEALQVGQWVEVWFSGPVTLSYPAQARAKQIVVLEKVSSDGPNL